MKHILEYGALLTVVGLVRILPYKGGLVLGWLLARFAFHILRWRVDSALKRIEEVFGDRFSPRERRQIAWISLRNLFFNAIEMIRTPLIRPEWIREEFDYEPVALFNRNRGESGAVLALPHMGNWELAGIAAQTYELPIFFLTGTQRNPLTDAYLQKMRSCTGIEGIPRTDPMLLRKVVRNLKAGKVLAILIDLRARVPAIPTPFLGTEANLAPGAALFARQANVPIIPAIIRRKGWSEFEWQTFDPVFPNRKNDREEEFKRLTHEVIRIFDDAIQETPEQFFWYNKRWVLDPVKKEE